MSNSHPPLRVLIVDDSSLYRKIVKQVFAEMTGFEVVDTAYDGVSALEQVRRCKPDLVTLDVEMPRLDGLETLKKIKAEHPKVGVIMLSALTSTGAKATTQALQDGAFDFVLKPSSGSLEENAQTIGVDLRAKARAFAASLVRQSVKVVETVPAGPAPGNLSIEKPEAVCIGVSTGGPQALSALIPALPARFPLPIFIVQHMPPMFTKSLAEHLNAQAKIPVCEASDLTVVRGGGVYIAPGGKQMKVHRHLASVSIQVTDDPAEGACKPSVDYLFRSMADAFGGKTLAIVMTGMGQDGLAGARILRQLGARVIAQDQASCTVFGMPRQIIENRLATEILPLDQIAPRLHELTLARMLSCS